jgi:ornithine cyclodeaminase/alanine dehydrogenase-like protein (mu-crystallin family)
MPNEIILLSRRDIESLMPFAEYVAAIANGFRLHAEGQAATPAPLHIPVQGGGFHVKSASLTLGRRYVAIKTNANFPQNRRVRDLPTIQGAILLLDAEDGRPLAFLDSIEITIKRTGAATAVAARYLARPESRTATICGAGPRSARCAPPCPRHQAGLCMGQGCRHHSRICSRDVETTRRRHCNAGKSARGDPRKRCDRDMHSVA